MRFFNSNNDNGQRQSPHCWHGYSWTDITNMLLTGNNVQNALKNANPLREVDEAVFRQWRDDIANGMNKDKYR